MPLDVPAPAPLVVTAIPDGDTAYQVPPKVLTPWPVTSPGALSLTNVYKGHQPAVRIAAPLLAFASASGALMPLTVATLVPGTSGQY